MVAVIGPKVPYRHPTRASILVSDPEERHPTVTFETTPPVVELVFGLICFM
tara:strand:- start:441 stop:593 length:153 start_codon:yes stop_codon:yes gene_type:complete